MASKLYVGGLSYSTTSDGLREFFAQSGNVLSATVITDRFSGQSRGSASSRWRRPKRRRMRSLSSIVVSSTVAGSRSRYRILRGRVRVAGAPVADVPVAGEDQVAAEAVARAATLTGRRNPCGGSASRATRAGWAPPVARRAVR